MISIVIPAYNEANRIGKSLRSIRAYQDARGISLEVLVYDDGSSDDTRVVVEKESKGLNCRVLQSSVNRGKGYGVRQGMMEALGEFVLFCDADLSTPIEEVEKMLKALENGADVAFGSRAMPESDVQIHQNFVRETMGKIFNLFARVFAFRGIRDSQCGFKCFKRQVAREIFSRAKIDGFCFDAEIAYLAQRLGYIIQEVPVIWRNEPESKVHIVSDPLKMFCDLLRIRWLHRNDG